jgi:hypothetical protein
MAAVVGLYLDTLSVRQSYGTLDFLRGALEPTYLRFPRIGQAEFAELARMLGLWLLFLDAPEHSRLPGVGVVIEAQY